MRKPSQADRLLALLSDGIEHSTSEIQQVVYGGSHLGTARIASRVNDLRVKGHHIPTARRDDENHAVYWYRLHAVPKPLLKWVGVTLPDGTAAMRQIAA